MNKVSDIHKSFANNLSAYSKLSKTQISKVIQSGGFLGKRFWTLMNVDFWPIMKNVIKLLPKSILIPLELTASVSAANAGIYKKEMKKWNK